MNLILCLSALLATAAVQDRPPVADSAQLDLQAKLQDDQIDKIKQLIVELKMQQQSMATKYGSKHPRMQELERRIEHWTNYLDEIDLPPIIGKYTVILSDSKGNREAEELSARIFEIDQQRRITLYGPPVQQPDGSDKQLSVTGQITEVEGQFQAVFHKGDFVLILMSGKIDDLGSITGQIFRPNAEEPVKRFELSRIHNSIPQQ